MKGQDKCFTTGNARNCKKTCGFCECEGIGDGYCNDNNNNFDCMFDDGDCCHNSKVGWDKLCNTCECKEPQWAAAPNCIDNWPTNNCTQLKAEGKCYEKEVAGKCRETCNFCGCIGIGDSYCYDQTNNEDCNFDDGDCCYNNGIGWDEFCDVCECKDPNAE